MNERALYTSDAPKISGITAVNINLIV